MMHFKPPAIPSDKAMPILEAVDGARYGREMSIALRDELDSKVDTYISRLTNIHSANECLKILDIGGATGYRASQFATFGTEVFVVDICDKSKEITQRNYIQSNLHPITFIKGDAGDCVKDTLPKLDWSLINMRRVLHWMSYDEAKTFLTTLPYIAGRNSHIALCFHKATEKAQGTEQHPKSIRNNFYNHRPKDILDIMKSSGYQIVAHGQELLVSDRNYAIFAKLPRSPACNPH